ncbi:MAG: hypothetical protein HOY75_12980 [Streptomyces sp.]|nr:hypothetical protein [Streptomyces sp.]
MKDVLIGLFADLSVVRAVSLAVGVFALSAPPVMFLARVDFARLLEDGRFDRLLIAVGPVLAASREACRDAAALLILLTTRPKEARA